MEELWRMVEVLEEQVDQAHFKEQEVLEEMVRLQVEMAQEVQEAQEEQVEQEHQEH